MPVLNVLKSAVNVSILLVIVPVLFDIIETKLVKLPSVLVVKLVKLVCNVCNADATLAVLFEIAVST